MRVTLADPLGDLEAALLTAHRRTTLLAVYTTAAIILGLAALAITTVAVPLSSRLAIPGPARDVAPVAGLAAWIVYGLVGGTRTVRDPGGHAVLTLHLPFISAALLLGGPTAGAWVAMIATLDRRELREVPWYGVLANHAGLALAAVLGGAVMDVVRMTGGAVGLPQGLALDLAAGIAGTLTLTVLSAALAAGVVVLRDGLTPREAVAVMDRSFRSTAVAETLLGWLFAVTWSTVGWWTPMLCTAIVLSLWKTSALTAEMDRDDLTGVLSRRAFALRVAEAADRARRGIEGSAYLFLDLDNFKRLNDGPHDHLVGDQVLAEVGRRLRGCVRVTDAVGRRGGDEFTVLFTGVRDEVTALRLAQRIHEAILRPFATDDGEHVVGASIGVALLVPHRRDFEPDVRQHADAAMYLAKEAGGGIRLWEDPDLLPDLAPAPDATH